MNLISRGRQSGKTIALLHHMELNSPSIYVARTEELAKRAHDYSQILGLHLGAVRFAGAADIVLGSGVNLLVDDVDYIIERHPEIGYKLLPYATVITVTEEP